MQATAAAVDDKCSDNDIVVVVVGGVGGADHCVTVHQTLQSTACRGVATGWDWGGHVHPTFARGRS